MISGGAFPPQIPLRHTITNQMKTENQNSQEITELQPRKAHNTITK